MQKRIDTPEVELKERLVYINRVAKVVKGGRNFRFTALMVVGDGEGRVGVGLGKATEIPEAVRKGVADAKRHMIQVPVVGTTIPHAVEGKYSKGHVRMLPAEEGTGVIAGGPLTASRRPWMDSASCALRKRSRVCAARPWKRSSADRRKRWLN